MHAYTHTQTHFKPEVDVEVFSEPGGTDPSDSSRISSNDSDGNEELGVHTVLFCMSPKETPKAMLTLRCYFMK